jgi:hypothetical protein
VIVPGINARLVLTVGDEVITIQPRQRGTVTQLAGSNESSLRIIDGPPAIDTRSVFPQQD